MVAISLGKGKEDIDFNIISSVFGKGYNKVVDWLNKGYATYINKEKALSYLHHSAPIAEALSSSKLSDAAKVVKDFENKEVRFRKKEFNRAVLSEQVRRSLEEQHYDRYVKEQTKKLLGYVIVWDASARAGAYQRVIILRGLRCGCSYENAKIKEGVLVSVCSRDKSCIGEFVNEFVIGRRRQEKRGTPIR